MTFCKSTTNVVVNADPVNKLILVMNSNKSKNKFASKAANTFSSQILETVRPLINMENGYKILNKMITISASEHLQTQFIEEQKDYINFDVLNVDKTKPDHVLYYFNLEKCLRKLLSNDENYESLIEDMGMIDT